MDDDIGLGWYHGVSVLDTRSEERRRKSFFVQNVPRSWLIGHNKSVNGACSLTWNCWPANYINKIIKIHLLEVNSEVEGKKKNMQKMQKRTLVVVVAADAASGSIPIGLGGNITWFLTTHRAAKSVLGG